MNLSDISDWGREAVCLDLTAGPLFVLDIDIAAGLDYARKSGHASINTAIAHDNDCTLVAQLMRTRKNNKKARAFAGETC